MRPTIKIWLLSGMTLGVVASCNNINRDSEDVSARAATITADTLETMKLSEIGSVGSTSETTITADTIPDNSGTAQSAGDDSTYTETEVVQIDTVSTRIVYDIRRRTIEQVDTVGATKTYEIRKRMLKRTVMLDTLTETEDQEQTVAFQTGDYKVLSEQVKEDTAVKVVDYQESKRQEAEARAKSIPAPAAQPTQQPTPSSTANQSSQADSTSQSTTAQPSSASTPAGQATSPSQPSTTSPSSQPNPSAPNSSSQVRTNAPRDTTQQPATGTAKQDTTRQRSESGS